MKRAHGAGMAAACGMAFPPPLAAATSQPGSRQLRPSQCAARRGPHPLLAQQHNIPRQHGLNLMQRMHCDAVVPDVQLA